MNTSLMNINYDRFAELIKDLDNNTLSKLTQLAKMNGIAQSDIDKGISFIKQCQGGQ